MYQELIESLEHHHTKTHLNSDKKIDELVHITIDGKVFRRDPTGNHWLILGNFKKACGWYDVKSNYINKIKPNLIVTRDGSTTTTSPKLIGKKTYNIKNLYYTITEADCPKSDDMEGWEPQNEGCEEIFLYIVSNDNNPIILGYMYPLYGT
jgi:hypothetical protein